jgi:hypothetical protein
LRVAGLYGRKLDLAFSFFSNRAVFKAFHIGQTALERGWLRAAVLLTHLLHSISKSIVYILKWDTVGWAERLAA